jgi:hypothetical protein
MNFSVPNADEGLLYARNLAGRLQYELRIDARIVPADAKEQVRSCGAACGPDASENLALFNLLALHNAYVRKMKAHANQAIAMVNEHGVAFEKHVFRHYDCAVRDC